MKILVDARLLSRGGASGIEEYTRNLLDALLSLDKENQYAFFYNGLRSKPLGFPAVNWKIPNKLLDAGVRFFGFPAIDDFIKTDLVFSPHFNILKTRKAPRVITFHDLSFLHHPYFFSRRQRFWHWLQDIKTQAREAAKIIAVSEFTKSDLVNLLGVPPEKVEVVYSGISTEFNPNLRRSERLRLERPYFLYLGTLEPRKNVPAIIRAFNLIKTGKDFSDWRLVIAGRRGWIHAGIDKEIAKSPFQKDIVLIGPVKSEERVSLYNSARVFVYPSFFEGFGFPPLEAQRSGCPVVASDRTSLPEVLGESALLVNPWEVENLAEALRAAALDGKLRSKLIGAGLENAKRFNWADSARNTINVFKKIF